MTPEKIDAYRTFLQKQVEMTERRLPNATERVTQTATSVIENGTALSGKAVTTPLGWVAQGLTTAGKWVRDGLQTVSEKTGKSFCAGKCPLCVT